MNYSLSWEGPREQVYGGDCCSIMQFQDSPQYFPGVDIECAHLYFCEEQRGQATIEYWGGEDRLNA